MIRQQRGSTDTPVAAAGRLLRLASTAAGIMLLVTAAGESAESIACDGPLRMQHVAQLLFGRNVEDQARVTEADFNGFVSREVSPRFPDGFTVLDATGHWRDARRGTVVHEASKVIEIVLPGGNDDTAKVHAIVEAYKQQFQQQSVGLIVGPACVRF